MQETGILEVGHDVADGGRRELHAEPTRHRAAADRLAGFDIGFDDVPEDFAAALVELCDHGSA